MKQGSLLLLLSAALLTLVSVFYVWQRFEHRYVAAEVVALRRQQAQLEDTVAPLRAEASRLSSPQRIEAIALKRLGMQRPNPAQIRRLSVSVSQEVHAAERP